MANHVPTAEVVAFANGDFDWTHATFYTNLVVGPRATTPFQYGWTTYNSVLATQGLSEYVGALYTPDLAMPAMAANSSGELVIASPPGIVEHVGLGPNTAEGGADIRALCIIRQVGGGVDPVVDRLSMWIEDGFSVNPAGPGGISINGGSPDLAMTWNDLVMPTSSMIEDYYHVGAQQLLQGDWDWATETAAGNLYMNLLVGAPSEVPQLDDATVQAVLLHQTRLYSTGGQPPGYTPDVILPPMQVTTEGTYATISPVTLPWEQTYAQLWENVNLGGAPVWGILVARKAAPPAVNYASDTPVCLIRNNISRDADDVTVTYKLQGTRLAMRFQWHGAFARMQAV